MAHALFFYDYPGYIFSNFAACVIRWRDRIWQTSEHAYHAGKFSDVSIQDEIRAAPTPHVAKQISHARAASKRADWNEETKLALMEEILRAKLEQHPWIQELLLATGDLRLVEDSTDEFWGRGQKHSGANHLGRLWMKLRDELREKQAG